MYSWVIEVCISDRCKSRFTDKLGGGLLFSDAIHQIINKGKLTTCHKKSQYDKLLVNEFITGLYHW